MHQRSGIDRRRGAERDAAQPMGGQPREAEADEELEQPERVPSFLSAREFEFNGAERRSGQDRRATQAARRIVSSDDEER